MPQLQQTVQPKTACVVTVYKQVPQLQAVLKGLALQSQLPDEVIVAEDDNSAEVAAAVSRFQAAHPQLKIRHLSQDDSGFRKSTIANKAVCATRCEHLVFLDGDCIPHPQFIRQVNLHLKPGVFVYSRPVYLAEAFVDTLPQRRGPMRFSLLELIVNKARSVECGIYWPFKSPSHRPDRTMIGNGWACTRADFLAVNGYDEVFNLGGYGFEDTDLDHRLSRLGCKGLFMKNLAIYYHCGRSGIGESKTTEKQQRNLERLRHNDRQSVIRVEEGASQWLNTQPDAIHHAG